MALHPFVATMPAAQQGAGAPATARPRPEETA